MLTQRVILSPEAMFQEIGGEGVILDLASSSYFGLDEVGVRLTDGALEGHAWVEHAGVPINDRPDVSTDFAPFAEPISPSQFTTP